MNFASSTTWYNLAQVAKCKSEYKSSRMGLTSQSCSDCRNNNDILSMCNKFADRRAAGSPHPRTGNVGKFHQGGGRGWWGGGEGRGGGGYCILRACTHTIHTTLITVLTTYYLPITTTTLQYTVHCVVSIVHYFITIISHWLVPVLQNIFFSVEF